jgi:cyclopropane fatty-acyl-phospholipid synthase-like methyltransferase
MLGRDDVAAQIAHGLEFLAPFGLEPGAVCVDLGSGGGVPGLPLAAVYPGLTWLLVDSWEARCAHLERAVRRLDLEKRVRVVHGRAEELARGTLRARADVVVARAFGPLPTTLECGAPMLRDGGRIVVSVTRDREPPVAVPEVGLERELHWDTVHGAFCSYARRGPVNERFPRRPAAQRRAPLF